MMMMIQASQNAWACLSGSWRCHQMLSTKIDIQRVVQKRIYRYQRADSSHETACWPVGNAVVLFIK